MKRSLIEWINEANNILGWSSETIYNENLGVEENLKEEIRIIEEFENRCFDL